MVTEQTIPPGLLEAFRRGGAMGALMARHDWAATPLGPPAGWSPMMRAGVALLLASRAQIVSFWGPDLVALYNDAYAPTIGDKHPRALGRPARESWAELWDDLGPLLHGVVETGEAFHAADRPFYIDRRGFLERVFFDVSYSPARDEEGRVEGVVCIVTETTARVLTDRRLRSVGELGRRIAGLGEGEAWAAAVERLAAPQQDADAVVAQIHLTTRRGLRCTAAAGGAPRLTESVRARLEDLPAEGAEVATAGVVADPPAAAAATGLAVPLLARGRAVGALVLVPGARLPLDEGLRAFAAGAAEQLSRALADHGLQEDERRRGAEARRTAERQRAIATVLQRAILPERLPDLEGASLAARYRPGEEGLEVGGDWYDAFEVRRGTLALTVGDVVGRGVEAAATMAQLRNGLRAYLAEAGGPGEALGRLHGLADAIGVDFCTVACLEVDVATGDVRCALAGHPPPLVVAAAGRSSWLPAVGTAPIGFGGARPAESVAHLPPGGTLVVYTDGLVERRDRPLTAGLQRLAALAAGHAAAPPGDLLDGVIAGLAEDGARDDIAVVAVRRG